MSWRTVPLNWMRELSYRGVFHAEELNFLHVAFEEGGFIAGGFARVFAHAQLFTRRESKRSEETWHQIIDRYSACRGITHADPPYGTRVPVNVLDPSTRMQWRGGVGDIDIFFRDLSGAQRAMERIERELHTGTNIGINRIGKSPGGFAEEYIVRRRPFQIITKVLGTPEEVVGTFDITNAKVWLDVEGIHHTEEWHDLECKQLLGLDQWDRPSILWRVTKWMRKHNLLDLRPGDHAKYVELVYKAAEAAKNDELKAWGRKIEKSRIQSFAKQFLYRAPPADALKASMLLDSYDQLNYIKDLASKSIENDKR